MLTAQEQKEVMRAAQTFANTAAAQERLRQINAAKYKSRKVENARDYLAQLLKEIG